MKAKLITSILLGFLLPWSYFLIVRSEPIRIYDQAGNETIGSSGIVGFIEFYGIVDSLIVYSQAAIVCTLIVFVICFIYEKIAKKCAV